MPELPEVETIKRYLEKEIIGQKILEVKILDKKALKGNKNLLVKRKILEIERIGKMLNLKLDKNINLLFHLKMTGQLLYLKNSIDLKPRIIFYLSKGFLIFNDVRKFGWVKVLTDEEREGEIGELGVDALLFNYADLRGSSFVKAPASVNTSAGRSEDKFTMRIKQMNVIQYLPAEALAKAGSLSLLYLKSIFSKTKRPIKLVLMDQTKIAGLGNIYANEILFLAKIHPKMPANKLSEKQFINLIKAIREILKRAIKSEGTSFRFYLKPDASKGSYQEKFLVYQREGEKCYYCQSRIKKIVLGGRSTFYCPHCQNVI